MLRNKRSLLGTSIRDSCNIAVQIMSFCTQQQQLKPLKKLDKPELTDHEMCIFLQGTTTTTPENLKQIALYHELLNISCPRDGLEK